MSLASAMAKRVAVAPKKVPPKIMSQINSTGVFTNTKFINSIISNINVMMTYFIGEFTPLRNAVLTEDDVNSEVSSHLEPLTTQINTLSAKIDSLMNNYGEFGSAPPAKGGRRSKRRTMKKRK